jgi:hypothetical protein
MSLRIEHKNENDKFIVYAKTGEGYDLTTVTIELVPGEAGKPETNTVKVTTKKAKPENTESV